MRTRAERRAKDQTYKEVAKNKIKEDFRYHPNDFETMNKHEKCVRIGKQANTRTLCSCSMCRSPRKFHGNSKQGLTMQETRLNMRASDLY